MSKIVVTGGQQRKRTLGVKEWSQYEKGVILVLDANSGRLLNKHEYVSPARFTPDQSNASVLFKSSTVLGDRLYACTQTEVIVYSLPDFHQEAHFSLACFNDVHHVVPTQRDTLLVASTGLDLVVEINLQGDIVNEWFTVDSSNWQRFSKDTDYRKIMSTKPHHSHPNFVFEHNGQIWVTRFEQKDALCLTASGHIDIGVERPHDGFVLDDCAYFTTINGYIVEADLQSQKILRSMALEPFFKDNSLLGWCRGLYPLSKNQFIVGFSRIRASAIHKNLLWAKQRLEKSNIAESNPTRIAKIDVAMGCLDWEYDLEPYGLNAVFSVQVIEAGQSG